MNKTETNGKCVELH